MSQAFHYGWEGVDTDLGTAVARLGDFGGYSQKAENGDIGASELTFDDPDATLDLEGHGDLWVAEDDCPAGDRRLFSGYIGEQTYGRGDSSRPSLRVGGARQVTVQLQDLNAVASFLIFHSGTAVRPAETDVERVQWLLSDPGRPLWSATDDPGFVDTSGPVDMDANDYTGQTPADVLRDCALASGKNWFIGFWEPTGNAFLWYADSNTSTDYTSELLISNVLADIDWVTTFPPKLGTDAELSRSPTRRYKGVFLSFGGGYAYKTNSDSALGYAWRDGSAPNANVTTQTAADAEAQRLADDATGQDHRVTCTVQLPSSLATGIKAGQRIRCKFSHLPGYESWSWFRVMALQVAQDEATDQRYTFSLELTPQTVTPSYGAVTVLYAGGDGPVPNWSLQGSDDGASWTDYVAAGDLIDGPNRWELAGIEHRYWRFHYTYSHVGLGYVAGTGFDFARLWVEPRALTWVDYVLVLPDIASVGDYVLSGGGHYDLWVCTVGSVTGSPPATWVKSEGTDIFEGVPWASVTKSPSWLALSQNDGPSEHFGRLASVSGTQTEAIDFTIEVPPRP